MAETEANSKKHIATIRKSLTFNTRDRWSMFPPSRSTQYLRQKPKHQTQQPRVREDRLLCIFVSFVIRFVDFHIIVRFVLIIRDPAVEMTTVVCAMRLLCVFVGSNTQTAISRWASWISLCGFVFQMMCSALGLCFVCCLRPRICVCFCCLVYF